MQRGGFLKDLDTEEKKRLYKIIEERPRRLSHYKEIARLMRADGQYGSALEILEKALKAAPSDVHIRHHIGRTYYEAGQHDKALRQYRGIIKDHPEEYVAYEKLEKICRETGRFEEAIKAYRRIGRDNKLKERSYQRIHYFLVETLQDFERGAKNLLEAIKEFGPNYRRCKDLGRIFAKRGEWKKAAKYYKMALEFKKDDVSLMGLLGWALVESGHLDEAERYFKQIAGTFQGMLSLAELYLKMGELDKSAAQLDRAHRSYPGNSRIRVDYADLVLKRGEVEKARSICEKALESIPSYFAFERAHAHGVLEEACRKMGQKKQAASHGEIAAAIRKSGDTYSALVGLAERKIAARVLDEAEELLGRLLKLYPGNTRALVDRCEIELIRRQPRRAVQFGEEGLRGANPKYREERLKGHRLLTRAYSLLRDERNSRRHRNLAEVLQREWS
jgi:tetratricopeptide (TPR) repeat protein